MNPDELRALARLPGTRTELEAVGKLLGAPAGAIRLDASMTEAALRSADLSNVRILHLATHGLTASEAGQRGARTEPGLVFTPPAEATSQDDGYLAASEVLTLNLTAVDWVILSACNTAAPSGTPGEPGLSGLARAFFYAGAPSLLVSHWPVGDDVAAALTVNTLRRTQAGESRAAALQNAMRDIRNDPNNPSFAHPSAWAPFTIAGEGR
jgi:CHAT domain-containing protein